MPSTEMYFARISGLHKSYFSWGIIVSTFSDFQMSEYDHVAQAHFKAIEAVSTFFRYYLLVMSLPITIATLSLGILARNTSGDQSSPSTTLPLIELSAPFFLVIGSVGFCMMIYIVNLRMDVTLYSRVVNSIRKYFYDEHNADWATKAFMRHLPQSAHIPKYTDAPFVFVISAFAVFNTLYLALGVHIIFSMLTISPLSLANVVTFKHYDLSSFAIVALTLLSFFLTHYAAYFVSCWRREHSYLRNTAIGIDIDGVLNKHREKFCEHIKSKLGINLQPDDIKLLPVHENTDLSEPVSRSDERAIFNDPDYWTRMPALEGAAEAIASIKKGLLLPIHVFTHRPWPDTVSSGDAASWSELREQKRRWRSAASEYLEKSGAKFCVRVIAYIETRISHKSAIKYITRYWLYRNKFLFDSLLVERGNENIAYSRGRYRNRFNYAKKKKIRFFVEDDWAKAVKLSYICDFVFLIDHPYNRSTPYDASTHHNEAVVGKLPSNVIRVESWSKLKKIITQLV